MSGSWENVALNVGSIIQNASKRYPQLIPLHTSWMNFARKHQVQQPSTGDAFLALLETHGLKLISTADFDKLASKVKRQDEEIKVLEFRIKTLLRTK